MNLGASRKVVVLAVALLACHVLVLALHRALLSNLVELALAAVTAAAAYQTAQRARGFARRFWRLIGVSFTIYTLGQVFYTYYDSILHASPLIWWPSDALLLFYVAPMVMTLFLGDDSAEASAFSSQRKLDFLQVGIVTLSTYLFFFYEPWQSGASPQAMALLIWRVEIVRDVVITSAFALRALLTRSRLVRSLFGRVALFLFVFSVGDLVYVYVQTWGGMPNASWYELLWTVPRTLLIGLAASWTPPAEAEPEPDKSFGGTVAAGAVRAHRLAPSGLDHGRPCPARAIGGRRGCGGRLVRLFERPARARAARPAATQASPGTDCRVAARRRRKIPEHFRECREWHLPGHTRWQVHRRQPGPGENAGLRFLPGVSAKPHL